jgi:hypothetical protein
MFTLSMQTHMDKYVIRMINPPLEVHIFLQEVVELSWVNFFKQFMGDLGWTFRGLKVLLL